MPSYLGRTLHSSPLIPLPHEGNNDGDDDEGLVNGEGLREENDPTVSLLDRDKKGVIDKEGDVERKGSIDKEGSLDKEGDKRIYKSKEKDKDTGEEIIEDVVTGKKIENGNTKQDNSCDKNKRKETKENKKEVKNSLSKDSNKSRDSPRPSPRKQPSLIRADSQSESRKQIKAAYDMVEQQSAVTFVTRLQELLPSLLQCYSIQDVDQMLLEFASNLCKEQDEDSEGISNGPVATLNGDGVYLAAIHTLLLNLKLICCGYYTSEEKSLPISEEKFLDDILGSGLIIYLSPVWVSKVYRQIITFNLLEESGFNENNADLPIIHLITDIDGLNSRHIGGQLLRAHSSSSNDAMAQRSINENEEIKDKYTIEAGQKFARRLLLVCWEGILDVLSVLLNGSSSCGITSSLALLVGGMEETQRARQAICTSLDGLQKAARLSCVLGLQDRCGAVFEQLAAACCVIEDFRREDRKAAKIGTNKGGGVLSSSGGKLKLTKLHASHALSMDVVLTMGLEMSSHSTDCWKHVFRCCAHLSELEHTYFSSGDNQSNLPKVALHQESIQTFEDAAFDMEMDELYTGAQQVGAVEPVAPRIDVSAMINESRTEAGWESALVGTQVLSANQAANVLCGLSNQVDRLFDEASDKLNMKSFVSFISELCSSSQEQLSVYSQYSDIQGYNAGMGGSSIPANALHLHRLGHCLMRALDSDRPIIHIMKAWTTVVPHLVDCACHWDHNISKKAVNCIHEFITTLINKQKELQCFHFNESLCKPLENLVCLELCDGDTQDQIVCSICELVEACANDIHSGWRPLFGALRAIKIEYTALEEVNEARQRHIEAVLEVFDVFLNSDNVLVFTDAAVDCILCLLKYVKGPGEFESMGDGDSDSGSELTPTTLTLSEDLCLPALKYLQQCCTLLANMWDMPACPRFNAADSIQLSPIPKIVDRNIHGIDLNAFQQPFKDHLPSKKGNTKGSDVYPDSKKETADSKTTGSNDSGINNDECGDKNGDLDSTLSYSDQYVGVPLEQLDKNTGVLRVWYLVLDGLASTANSCPKNFQPQTLEVLFDLLRMAAKTPGAEFSLHCVNHLILPMIQSWLRKGSQLSTFWDGSVTNFRQCCGLCTDLVVEYVIWFSNVDCHKCAVHFMLQQLLDVLIECVSQSNEAIARLGCSCIKHCLMSSGQVATESIWSLMLSGLQRAMDITVYSLRLLMTPFQEDSDNFYGDVGHVKIAVRKDCSGIECERLRQLAQQVFLLDNQRGTSSIIDYEIEEDRSYIFLIYPPNHETASNPNLIVTRVPFRSVVVGLLSHQLLIQLIGSLLLQGSTFMVKSERSVLPMTPLDVNTSLPPTPTTPTPPTTTQPKTQQHLLPGMLPYLSTKHVLLLLSCLESSYSIASQFDSRPGLKFLVQKVAKADVATNLYRYSSLALTFLMHTLIVINSHMEETGLENTRRCLSQQQQQQSGQKQSETEKDSVVPPVTSGAIWESTHRVGYTAEYISAFSSLSPVLSHPGLFLRRVQVWFDEICRVYVDLYLDKEGPSKADELSANSLVFLLAPDEELCTIKRDKSIAEMIAEKLQSTRKSQDKPEADPIEGDTAAAGGVVSKTLVTPQTSLDIVCPANSANQAAGLTNNTPSEVTNQNNTESKLHNNEDDKVYRVVTDKGIESLMSEYKKRKQLQTMPAFIKAQRSKPHKKSVKQSRSLDPVDQEIDQQQQQSIMMDGEAHLLSFVEVIVGILDVLYQLPDTQFLALQPPSFNCVTQLICHSKDKTLRRSLAQWTHRVGYMFNITPPDEIQNKY